MPRIQCICKSCGAPINMFTLYEDRGEMARNRGESFHCTCKKCHADNVYHVDTFTAKPNRWLLFAISVSSLLVSYCALRFGFDFKADKIITVALIMFPLLVYFVLKRVMIYTSNRFNSFYVGSQNDNPASD